MSQVPRSDLRRAYCHLLQSQKLDAAKGVMVSYRNEPQTGKEPTASRGSQAARRIVDRPLSYPFTKGITSLNDGVAYGEELSERWVRGLQKHTKSELLTVLRTRTGRTEPEGSNGTVGSNPPKKPHAVSDESGGE